MDATRCLDDFDPDFQYTHANSSHSWILNYPGGLKPDPEVLKISITRETYQEPKVPHGETKGKRKKVMEAFYRKIISEEVLKQYDAETVFIEDYETEFMDRFKDPDEMPLPGEICSKNEKLRKMGKEPEKKNEKYDLEDLKTKHPLYYSTPLSFISQITGRQNFRKNTTITKSPDKNYDNIEY